MFWPDTGTGVDAQPERKAVQSAVRKFFTEGGVGVPPTVPGGDWFNQITNEVLAVLAEAGISPSKVDDTQLLQAIVTICSGKVNELVESLASEEGASLSLSQVSTNYRISFSALGLWEPGESISIGQYRLHGNKVWSPNSNGSVCGSSPSFDNFHYVNPDNILTPENFGADPVLASQDAVNRLFVYVTTHSIGLAYVDKEYLVSTSTHDALPGTFGENSVCLNLLDNLKCYGPGSFKLADGSSAASGAVLGNWSGETLFDCTLDIDVNGNKNNTSGSISGVVFVDGVRCQWMNGRKIIDTTFNGLQFALGSLACVADRPYIEGCLYIGLQAQRPDGLQVLHPRIYDVGDNGIDVEGNLSSSDQTQIVGPTVNGCNNAIFLESTGNTVVSGGTTEACAGYHLILNQINTPSANNIIFGLKMKKGSGAGNVAAVINNNSGYSSIYGCRFEGFEHSFLLSIAVGVHIGVNNHKDISLSIISITRQTSSLIRSFIDEQILETERVDGKPFCCSPIDNPLNFADRDFSCTIKPMRELFSNVVNGSPDDDYKLTASSLSLNSSWGAYSVYVDGETVVYMKFGHPVVGHYIEINGVLYLVYANNIADEYIIRDSSGAAGNFTANTNGEYTTQEFYTQYMTY
ncbi:MAG: hypothetical protein PHV54_05295 [Tolumonas sp.]|nr:hypothetical protein [Tolumonas sp.]